MHTHRQRVRLDDQNQVSTVRAIPDALQQGRAAEEVLVETARVLVAWIH